jgi:hypothetical protein
MAMMTLSTQRTDIPELAQWVLATYKDWSDNRAMLEDKWTTNRDAFRGEDAVSWQDPDADEHGSSGDDGSTTFPGKTDWHSRHTVRITKQKVMTAFALVVDAVLQGGKIPFLLKLSGELAVNAEDLPQGAAEEIDNQIGDMTQRIQQQLSRSKAERAFAKAVLAGAVYGRAWCKFTPRTFTSRRMVAAPPQPLLDPVTGQPAADPATGQPAQAPEQWGIEKAGEVGPAVTFVSGWDIFADLEAEDKRRSAGIIHRQYVSPRELRQMAKDSPGWDAAAVTRALRESARQAPSQGDSNSEMIPRLRDVSQRKNTVRMLECWVQVPREYVDRFEAQDADTGMSGGQVQEAEAVGDDIPCLIVLAAGEIVRFMRLEEDEPWPFYSIPWEEDIDEADTWGVADNLAQTQSVLNSAVRCFEDNKRFSSALILGLKRRLINNPKWDGKIKPGMVLEVGEDARSIADALSSFVVPDVGQSLLTLIEMFRTFADEESMTPKIQAGGRDNQQTAYEASIRVEKAGKYMGAVVKNYDEYLIAPVVQDFYEWNMLDPAVQTGKGPFDVIPLGFTSFQDRVIRLQAIQQFLGMVLADPELRSMVKLDDALREICKALDLDPDQWLKSLQDIQAEAQQQQPNPAEALAMEQAKAGIEKTKVETVKAAAETEALGERLKMERARTVKDLMPQPAESPAEPVVGKPVEPGEDQE